MDTATIKQDKWKKTCNDHSGLCPSWSSSSHSSPCLFIRRFCRVLPENRLFPPSLRFLPDAGTGALTRQPWKRKCKRSLMHHPLASCSLLEACQPISEQDHRKSPSAGHRGDGRRGWCVFWSGGSVMVEGVGERLETRRTKATVGGGGENTSPRTPAGCRNACYGCTSLPAPPPGAPKLRGKKEEMLIMCFLLFSS